jgi:hypothetical protein
MTGGAVAASGLDLLHDGRRRRHGEAATAIRFRDQRGEEARLRQRGDELAGIGPLAIELAPVLAGKLGAERAHGLAHLHELVGRLIGIAIVGHSFSLTLPRGHC